MNKFWGKVFFGILCQRFDWWPKMLWAWYLDTQYTANFKFLVLSFPLIKEVLWQPKFDVYTPESTKNLG